MLLNQHWPKGNSDGEYIALTFLIDTIKKENNRKGYEITKKEKKQNRKQNTITNQEWKWSNLLGYQLLSLIDWMNLDRKKKKRTFSRQKQKKRMLK